MASSTPAILENGAHPYDFHVSGPRNLSSPNWREIFSSSWQDNNYRRMAMACFIQAVYLLELDRQDNRSEENGLAPKWWKPFKYKLSHTLIDERDGSIFGAILEWDRSAALAEFILAKPSGAPRAVLVLRGTLLKRTTIRRDLADDLRFFAWESLKGSVRFDASLEALESLVEKHGSCNVCVAGHSLGAGFALQIGKALAKKEVFVETHLFNPPSLSIAMSLKTIGEKAGSAWNRLSFYFSSSTDVHPTVEEENITGWRWGLIQTEVKKWVPHLYLNNSDYICCNYAADTAANTDGATTSDALTKAGNVTGNVAAKLFITSKGPQKFLEAHGIEQWWSDDMELQLAISDSKLIHRQLKSVHSLTPSKAVHR